MFSAISHAVNRAWGIERPRPFWERKLLALGMVLTVSLLFLLSVATSVVVGLLSQLPLVKTDLASFDSLLWSVLSIVLPVSFMFVLLTLIYRLMPNTEVRWRVALTGAALATIAWEVAKEAFTFYLAHFARYELLYGQMEVFIILLLYFYFVGVILLMGAEFTAVYTRLLQEDSGSESSAPEQIST
jgi:membrane protein